ncbi:hypothetical protein DER44DRAFT_807411 [Fusarium oxysporum]|nr:hypothetical protein DER44DRAFT_807411 [Fusarium oxysporum]
MAPSVEHFKFRILIVGAGPAQGGTLTVQPAAARTYTHIGLGAALEAISITGHGLHFCSYKDSSGPIGVVSYGNMKAFMNERPAVQRMAYDASIAAGVTVSFDCHVIGLGQNALPVRLWTADGREYTADLIIAADGIKSKIQRMIYPDRDVGPVPTREFIFQSQVPHDILISDDRFSICRATAEGSFAMTSIVMDYGLPPAQGNIKASWTMPGDSDELRDMFKAFPVPQRAYLEHVSKCTKWRIAIAAEIPKWIGKSSRVILSAMPTTSAGMLLMKPKFTKLSIVAEELRRLIYGLRCMLSALKQC